MNGPTVPGWTEGCHVCGKETRGPGLGLCGECVKRGLYDLSAQALRRVEAAEERRRAHGRSRPAGSAAGDRVRVFVRSDRVGSG